MRCVRVLACGLAALSRAPQLLDLPLGAVVPSLEALGHRLEPPALGRPDGWPVLMLGAGLALLGLALGARVCLYDRGYLALNRATRLTLLLGLALGATLAALGLLAAVTLLLL
jgi:hypothetical protein